MAGSPDFSWQVVWAGLHLCRLATSHLMRNGTLFASSDGLCTPQPPEHHEDQSSLAWYVRCSGAHAGVRVRRDDLASHHRSSSPEYVCLDIVANLRLVVITLSMPTGTALRLHILTTLSTGLVISGSGRSLSDQNQVVECVDSGLLHLGLWNNTTLLYFSMLSQLKSMGIKES